MINNWLRLGLKIDEIRFSGGGSKSILWQVILTNLLNLPVKRVDQGASFGACILAGVGEGWWEFMEQGIEATLGISHVEEPTQSVRGLYQEYFDRYQKFYEILSATEPCF
jgi:xylulokinase